MRRKRRHAWRSPVPAVGTTRTFREDAQMHIVHVEDARVAVSEEGVLRAGAAVRRMRDRVI